MIAHLTGTLTLLDLRFCIVSVGGVGYKVYISSPTVESLTHSLNTNVSLHTYLSVRETALDLYGFLNTEDMEMFELLLGVSGIGPKSALAILSATNTQSIKEAVISGDTSYMTKVSGIGKKTAEKVVLELKEKIEGMGPTDISGMSSSSNKDMGIAIEGLKALGYSEREARDAIKDMPKNLAPEAMLREALKTLGS